MAGSRSSGLTARIGSSGTLPSSRRRRRSCSCFIISSRNRSGQSPRPRSSPHLSNPAAIRRRKSHRRGGAATPGDMSSPPTPIGRPIRHRTLIRHHPNPTPSPRLLSKASQSPAKRTLISSTRRSGTIGLPQPRRPRQSPATRSRRKQRWPITNLTHRKRRLNQRPPATIRFPICPILQRTLSHPSHRQNIGAVTTPPTRRSQQLVTIRFRR